MSSMTTLMEHSSAYPRECSVLPKKLMSSNNFFIALFLGCAMYDKNRALFDKIKFFKSELIESWQLTLTKISLFGRKSIKSLKIQENSSLLHVVSSFKQCAGWHVT